MRKVLLLCAAMAVLLVGSLSLGVAVARTGAPVFYDARTDPGAVGRLDPRAEGESPGSSGSGGEVGDATGAGGAGDARGEIDRGAGEPGERPRASDSPGDPTPVPTDPSPHASPDAGDGVATPPATPPPALAPTAEEQAAWLSFQQLVRDCMTGAGFEYRHWKWWEAESPDPNSLAPAMPESLGEAEQAAWREALYGDDAGGGCLVVAVEHDRDGASPAPDEAPDGGASPDGASPEAGAVDEDDADDGTGSSVSTEPEASLSPEG